MSKINDTTDYATVTPATGDLLIGTDISNTTNDANGETVTFTAQSIADLASGGGAWTFIATADASGDATINFTGFNASSYDNYAFLISNLIPANDGVNLYARTSTDGGSTYDSGAENYMSQATGNDDGTGFDMQYGNTFIVLSYASKTIGSETNEDGWSGIVYVHGPHLAKYTRVTYQGYYANNVGTAVTLAGAAARNAAADVDAIQFYFSAGNIESGTITMYGISNA